MVTIWPRLVAGHVAGLLALILAFLLLKHAWRFSRAEEAAKTDIAYLGIKEALVYFGAIGSLNAVIPVVA